jgi:hypothetical protein
MSMTLTKINALDAFIKGEKTAGRWDGIKRLYFPVWGVLVANAICMKSLTSGTFVGGVTPGAGFIQGNGVTGRFNSNTSPSSAGLLTGSQMYFALVKTADTGASGYASVLNAATPTAWITHSNFTSQMRHTNGGIDNFFNLSARADGVGIFTVNRTSTTICSTRRRKTSGVVTFGSFVGTATGVPTGNMFAMATNGTVQFHNGQLGCFGMSLSMADVDPFTLALKTLWETTTGLTLP